MDFSRYDTIPRYRDFDHEVATFLDEHLTDSVREAVDAQRDHHDPAFFRALGAKGWIIPQLPREEGGAGLDAHEIAILNLRFAVADAPILNLSTTRMAYIAVSQYIHPDLRDDVLPSITGGETALTLGYTEPEGGSDIATVKTSAVRDGDEWVINGSKVFTTGAHHARYSFLLTSSDPSAPKRRGLTMFLLPLDLPGVRVDALETMGERTNVVFFDDVRVPDMYRLGEENDGWTVLKGPLDAEHALTATEQALPGQAISYSRKLALALAAALEWVLDCERAERLRGDASDDPLVQRKIGLVAQLVATGSSSSGLTGRVAGADNWIMGVSELMDLVGPDGLVVGADPTGPIERSRRYAEVSSIYGGTVEVFKNLIARELGLPAPRYA